ncbi:MAG: DNA polymerase I [Flavobacteriales bacterium]
MAENDKKLFLLDAFALIFRGYFALAANAKFNPVNSKGVDTSAVLGFTNTLVELLKKEKPTHIAVVFDTAAPTVRHEEFAAYKANRDETPEAIIVGVPYIKEIIKAFRIPVLETDGYEADDVIGTLAKKAEEKGFTTYMMTPDKDFGQLVNENILIYKPGRFGNEAEVVGAREVCEKFGIERTTQVIDVLGLMGDKVDNIPGVPGVGPKTAAQLIKDYGSVENVLANTDKLKGKLKENLETYREQALLSKKLATILLDSPVEFNENDLILEEPDKDKLLELFSELEFRTLSKRILNTEIKTPARNGDQIDLFSEGAAPNTETEITEGETRQHKTIKDITHHYHAADTPEKVDQLIKELSALSEFCFDSETTSLEPLDAEIVGLSFAWKKQEAWYVPFPTDPNASKSLLEKFRKVFENENIRKIGQNIKYDYMVLLVQGLEVKGELFDTMLAHYLLEPEQKHGMDELAENYLDYTPVSITELIGRKGKEQGSMRDVPVELITEYAAEDADITLQLKTVFEPKLKEREAENLFHGIECPLLKVLAHMELEGVNLDGAFLNTYSAQLGKEMEDLEKEISKAAGTAFNLNSPKQLGQILFEVLKIDDKAKKTKTGQYATSEDVLQKLADKHPIINMILDFRELGKLKSTYVDALPEMVHPSTGRVHTSFMQAVTATGRLSSNQPNLQNIPIRTERGRKIRKAFIPRDKDHVLVSADYSQVELRLMAALSGDEHMTEAFRNNLDIHTATAARVFGVPQEEITKDMRSRAKAVNFGIIYGQSAYGLSQSLSIPQKEAKEIIDQYFTTYPGVKKYMEDCIRKAQEIGFVETLLGRRRYLPNIKASNNTDRGFAERNAINTPLQGSAADIIKIAMINIHNEMRRRNMKSKMVLQVHDELVFDAHISEVAELMPMVKEKMEKAVELSVPLIVEIQQGKDWLEAH